jgi:hypothetical protein
LRQLIERTLDLLQVLMMHVEIDQRGLDAFVAEKVFDREEVGAGF